MLKKHAEVVVAVSVLLAGALISAHTAIAGTNNYSPPLRARQLEGMKVEDSDGQKAGMVHNLVLDVHTGNLRYVVIGHGGFLGVRSTLKLAPAQLMSAATTKSQTLALNATTTQWRSVPAFKSSLTAIAEQDRDGEIARHFQTSAQSGLKRADISLSKTGRGESFNAQPAQLKFASDVIGLPVVNQKREKMGEIVDLLVSFGESHPAFVIISSGRLFHPNRQYAVPLNTLTFSGNELLWNVAAAALQNAPKFDQAAWEASCGDGRTYGYVLPAD